MRSFFSYKQALIEASTVPLMVKSRSSIRYYGNRVWDSPRFILGLLLFIIHLNDFEHCLKQSRPNMYANDHEITISSNNQTELMETAQAELFNVTEWIRINKLSHNPTKTVCMIIYHPRRRTGGGGDHYRNYS